MVVLEPAFQRLVLVRYLSSLPHRSEKLSLRKVPMAIAWRLVKMERFGPGAMAITEN